MCLFAFRKPGKTSKKTWENPGLRFQHLPSPASPASSSLLSSLLFQMSRSIFVLTSAVPHRIIGSSDPVPQVPHHEVRHCVPLKFLGKVHWMPLDHEMYQAISSPQNWSGHLCRSVQYQHSMNYHLYEIIHRSISIIIHIYIYTLLGKFTVDPENH